MFGRKLLENLESDIETFDRIVLIWEKGEATKRWLEAFYKSKAVRDGDLKLLVLSVTDGMMEMGTLALPFPPIAFRNTSFRHILESEARELCKLHHMYDFSDRFLAVPETEIYGGLFNLVDTGLLQMDEVWEALLH